MVALAAAYFLSQFYRSFLPVMYPVLSEEIGLDADWLSLASGGWYIVFAVAQFPVAGRLTVSGLAGRRRPFSASAEAGARWSSPWRRDRRPSFSPWR